MRFKNRFPSKDNQVQYLTAMASQSHWLHAFLDIVATDGLVNREADGFSLIPTVVYFYVYSFFFSLFQTYLPTLIRDYPIFYSL